MSAQDQIFSRIKDLESSARSYPNSFPAVFASADGNYITDVDGNRYLDFLTGAGVHVLGHNDPDVVKAVSSLKNPLVSTLDLSTVDKLDFLETLQSVLPAAWRNDTKFHCCGPTGGDSIEAALKLAQIYTGRAGVISFSGGYHGMSQGALGVSSNVRLRNVGLRSASQVTFGYFPVSSGGIGSLSNQEAAIDFSLAHLETLLSDDHSGVQRPGAVLMELIQGEGGNNVAPLRFVTGLAALCKRFGVLLIVDEIQSGMGRTGKFWAFEHYDIRPDIICMSKGIGGGFPIAMLAYRRELDVWKRGDHIGTFRGQGYAFAAGAAAIKKVRDSGLLARVEKISEALHAGILDIASRHEGIRELRGMGIYLGLEFTNSATAGMVQQFMFDEKIIIESGGRNNSVLRFLPPLTVTGEEIDLVLHTLERALASRSVRAETSSLAMIG